MCTSENLGFRAEAKQLIVTTNNHGKYPVNETMCTKLTFSANGAVRR